MAVMAMFPLGGVLFPFAYLPLHVFEPRYLEMVRYCLDSDAEFGVVLIERGSEVGGGDQRHMVATSARIVAVEESPDGRFGLIAQGTRRIRVEQWLPDFNYPQAEVEPWADSSMVSSTDAVVARLRRSLALAAELGISTAPATLELEGESEAILWQACSFAPLGAADRYELLCCVGAPQRTTALLRMLDDAIDTFSHRLRLG